MAKNAMKSIWDNKRKEDERLQKVKSKKPLEAQKTENAEGTSEDKKSE